LILFFNIFHFSTSGFFVKMFCPMLGNGNFREISKIQIYFENRAESGKLFLRNHRWQAFGYRWVEVIY
jgi:hypothetical protein